MIVFGLNLVLALLLAAVVGSVDTPHLVVGFLFGYGVLWCSRPLLGDTDYCPDGGPTTASRQTFVSGNAARYAARELMTRLKAVADPGASPVRLAEPRRGDQ